jgi:uncharacterized surface protein with fasciclin (FAS1) repeats
MFKFTLDMNSFRTLLFVCFLLCAVSACQDDDPAVFTTFEEETISSFLEKDTETYSEFIALLRESGMFDLLSAYGAYTLFAPNNEAVRAWYAENNFDLETIDPTSTREMVFNHILPVLLTTDKFPQGIFGTATYSERFLNLNATVTNGQPVFTVNETAHIVRVDQKVHNGVVHTVDAVIPIAKQFLPDIIAADKRFSLFNEALRLTGLADSLMLRDDPDYETGEEQSLKRNESKFMIYPPFRKQGHTVFMESDSTFQTNGISNIDDLKSYAASVYDLMYPADRNVSDPTSRNNSLNRFVAYHLINQVQATNEFFTAHLEQMYVPGTAVPFYMAPQCPNTLIEIIDGKYINRRRDGSSIQFLSGNYEAINGLYHEIDGIMVYDQGMETDVLNKRLRMDFTSFFPEMQTNRMRTEFYDDADKWIIPRGYLTGLSQSDQTQNQYISALGYVKLEGDVCLMAGKYDCTARTHPIPAGTYEVRIGYSALDVRGVGQLYFDGKPCGIPLNMTIYPQDARIGWILDAETEDGGLENDKMMRNRGFMKGAASLLISGTTLARDHNRALRKILTTVTFEKTEPHYFRVKCVEEKTHEFELDYIEFMPVSQLFEEDKY